MNPFFSIIVPTYNRATFLPQTLSSILNQSYPNFELIIVDDGSTDNTEDIVASIQSEKIKYYKISNSERGFARNFGAKQSVGEYLCFLDSDDVLYTHHLQTAKDIIEKEPNIPIFHLGYEIIFPKKIEKHYQYKNLNALLIFGNPLSCQAVFVKKKIFESFFFNEDRIIAGLEDWELWMRIATKYPIKHFPIITSAIIQSNERSVMHINKEKWIIKVEKFIEYVTSNPDVKNCYKNKLHIFYSGAYSYLSLHLSFVKEYNKEAFIYMIKALNTDPLIILKRRFYAIIRNIFINFIK